MHIIDKNDILLRLRRFLYPETCALCGALTGEGYICDGCREILDKEATYPTLNIDGSFGIAVFDEKSVNARRLIARAKYGKSRVISELFAEYLSRAIEKLPDGDEYFVTYIPRSRKGKRRSGADQCEMILATDSMKKRSGGAGRLLRRAYFFESLASSEQKHLARKHRFSNALSAFVYSSDKCSPDKVIVIDDITTSGASAIACRNILKSHGAERVIFAFIQAKGGVYRAPDDKRKV